MILQKLFSIHFLILLISISIGCVPASKNEKETINNPKEIITIKTDDAVELNLSEIFDTITFIPLINNKTGAVSVDKIIFVKDKIYILDKKFAKGVFIYSKNGEFIKRVGNIGRGPGEYDGVSDFDFDDNKIIISDHPNKLLIFNEKGDFISRMTSDFTFSSFISVDNGYLFFNRYRSSVDNCFFNVIKTDKNLKFMQGYLPYKKDLLHSNTLSYVSHFVRTDNEILFSQGFTNTVYSYKNGQFTAKIKFNFESKPIPENLTTEFIKPEDLRNIFTSGYSHLSEPFYSSSQSGFYKILYNGADKYVVQTPSKKILIVDYYYDDIFGIPLYSFKSISQNRLIGTVNWESVLMTLNDSNSDYNLKKPQLKAKLLGFMNKYNLNSEDAEPVIAIFKFKK